MWRSYGMLVVSHPDLLNGETPVSASNVQQKGHVSLLRPKREYVVPRALEIAEIHAIVEQYKQAAVVPKKPVLMVWNRMRPMVI